MNTWWINTDSALLCVSLAVLVLVPLWIRWLCKRQAAGFRPRRMVTEKVCERCKQEVEHLAYLEFDAYVRASLFRCRTVTLAQALCPNCVRQGADQLLEEATRDTWTYFYGPIAKQLTKANLRKALREYDDRHPIPDPDLLDLAASQEHKANGA